MIAPFRSMAEEMFSYIRKAQETGESVKMVIPVVRQGSIPILDLLNRHGVSCPNVHFSYG